ncbi:hypothetical protein V493_03046, partial [Pseudogymnoascus sp. VKM F-4281 (FW-2241)]
LPHGAQRAGHSHRALGADNSITQPIPTIRTVTTTTTATMSTTTFQRVHRTPKVKQACDCCHARKIKCDGTCPCSHCAVAELQCTYLTVPKKKGPKGPSKRTPRAILKMQMEQQRNRLPAAASPTQHIPPRDSSTISSPPSSGRTSNDYGFGFEPSPLLTTALVEQFAKSFFKHKYPLTPILHQGDFYAHTLPHFLTCPSKYALVASLCAAARTQVNHDQQADPSLSLSLGATPLTTAYFINEVRRARAMRDYVETPTLEDAQASFFIFAGLFDCDKHNSAWFYLREAITLMEALRLHEEATYVDMPAREALFSRRTFWLLFITERAYALQRHRPLSLNATIGLPTATTVDDDPDAEIISGFLDLLALFRNFNSDFVSTWNSSSHSPPFSSSSASISAAQLAQLQDTLALSAPPEGSQRTEIQKADLSITRLWLSTMTWQLCVAKGLLSSSPTTPSSLSFLYPITLSATLAAVAAPLTPSAFDANGPGILEKIFDIGCSLADVLLLHPPRAEAMQCGPRDSMREMMRVMDRAMGGRSRYRALLGEKAGEAMREGPSAGLDGGERVGDVLDGVEVDVGVGVKEEDEDGDADADLADYEALRPASVAWVGALGEGYPIEEGVVGTTPRGGGEVFY